MIRHLKSLRLRLLSWLSISSSASASSVPDGDRALTYYDGYYILCRVWDYLEKHDRWDASTVTIGIIGQAAEDVADAMRAEEQGRNGLLGAAKEQSQ
jgi:hypothetical protein